MSETMILGASKLQNKNLSVIPQTAVDHLGLKKGEKVVYAKVGEAIVLLSNRTVIEVPPMQAHPQMLQQQPEV